MRRDVKSINWNGIQELQHMISMSINKFTNFEKVKQHRWQLKIPASDSNNWHAQRSCWVAGTPLGMGAWGTGAWGTLILRPWYSKVSYDSTKMEVTLKSHRVPQRSSQLPSHPPTRQKSTCWCPSCPVWSDCKICVKNISRRRWNLRGRYSSRHTSSS